MEQLYSFFSGLRWQDALDILLNSYILFRLYVLFRGTNVIRAFLAICALWVAGQAAVSLGLIITNWAMQGVITVAALVVIVVFRNEISSVLQTRDLKSFFWGIPRYQLNTPLNTIIESVYEMAEKKIGALIVLPLKQGVGGVVQGGVPIMGSLSREMLVSVFWPSNPLHDGAAVIQGDKLIRAGGILPLSKRGDLPGFFGTRHRAAAGLAELTDAMVIVVSEERGKITVFKEHQIHNIRRRHDLDILLQDHAGDESIKSGFRQQTVELTTVALICLFSIAGMWFNFSKGMETLAEHEVPVEFMNPDNKMEIISSSTSSVKLLISGARPLINSLNPEQINITLDLSRSTVGVNKLAVIKENVLLPPGIQLKKIEPTQLEITLDTMVEKELPIQPYWTGKLPEGLMIESARAVPQTVKVIGGGLTLQTMSTIFTEQIVLDNITESGTITVGLVLNPASLKLNADNEIQVQYQVAKKQSSTI